MELLPIKFKERADVCLDPNVFFFNFLTSLPRHRPQSLKRNNNSPPYELLRSWSMKTELRSEEADCGGVGVLGEVGTDDDADVSISVSAILRKVILCGGSLSRATGWPFMVPEVDVRTGRIPGDFREYMVFLACRRNDGN